MKRFYLFIISLFCVLFVKAQNSICGVTFGQSYSTAETLLENKFGKPNYLSDKNTIIYDSKNYGGVFFSTIYFDFQYSSMGYSYFNKCIFIIDCVSAQEAKNKRDELKEIFERKYGKTDVAYDEDGFAYFKGGTSPVDPLKYGFYIDIIKKQHSYAARVVYGPYNYVNEEF